MSLPRATRAPLAAMLASAFALAICGFAAPQDAAAQDVPTQAMPKLDVHYVPTPQPVVDKMLEMAAVTKDDFVIDLGSGDGRIPITAAEKFGAKGMGVDLDPERIKEAKENAEKAKVTDKVEFRQEDLFKTDLSKATVITMYLLPSINEKLEPALRKLKPGTRIVSHSFDIGEWKPDRTEKVENKTIYFWVVPDPNK